MTLTSPPKTVAPKDKGRLAAGISASATSLTVSPIYKTVSGVRTKQGFDSTSGLAIISQGDFEERISFEGSSVDSTTKITTLSTVTRGLSFNSTTASFSGGTGRSWPKGAKITVVADASYFQSGVYTNTANTFTAAQTINSTLAVTGVTSVAAPFTVSGTSSYVKLPELTTTQRDALTAAEGMLIKNSTTGTIQQYVGGAWASVGTDATPNAANNTAGKVDIASATEIGAGTATDATSGAINVIPVSQTTKTSNGASDENKVPVLQSDGALHINHIATGTPDGTKFVRDDGTLVTPTGTNYSKVVQTSTTASSANTAGSETVFDNHTYTIPANDLVSGVWYECEFTVDVTSITTSTLRLGLQVGGSSTVFNTVSASTSTTGACILRCRVQGTTTAGAAASVQTSMDASTFGVASPSGTYLAIANKATNGTLTLVPSGCFGGGSSGSMVIRSSRYIRHSTTAS